MALEPGSRIGAYEIVSRLGAGGRGEVYRAHDSELGRDVAVKTLPATFAADRDRVARFEREARILATLNHPNIATLFGVERQAGELALVLKLVASTHRRQWLAAVATAVLVALGGCRASADAPIVSAIQTIQTLQPGVVTIAITGTATDLLDPEAWMYRYAERLGQALGLRVVWKVVPFDKSWTLAGQDVVDVVATNLASFPDRVSLGGTFSTPFLYEQRALRIRASDRDRYRTIADFKGRKVGAVTGMAAERDLRHRAPEGVQIVATATFPELYAQFARGELDAVAQAEYFTLDGRIIPSYGPDLTLIDHHDLNPGQREESVFVVRDKSTGLLAAVNAFVKQTPFPLHLPR